MERFSNKALERAILEAISKSSVGGSPKAHKITLIGRAGAQPGAVETLMGVEFTHDEGARAALTFEQMKRNGYIRSTLDDLVDPENWVTITGSGTEYLQSGRRDHIDRKLAEIAPHLVELRDGMWDALARTSPDAPRQAAHSARELIDQFLKEGTPAELKTRKERFAHLMRENGGAVSKGDIEIADASYKLIEAVHNKLVSEAHARRASELATVRNCVESAEHILRLVFAEAASSSG